MKGGSEFARGDALVRERLRIRRRVTPVQFAKERLPTHGTLAHATARIGDPDKKISGQSRMTDARIGN